MTSPLGYRYAAAFAGIRKVAKDDIALIVSDTPATAAAVFTRNRVVAAPVEIARTNLQRSKGRVRAVLVNAGNANCATRTGKQVAIESVRAAAKALGTLGDGALQHVRWPSQMLESTQTNRHYARRRWPWVCFSRHAWLTQARLDRTFGTKH